MFYFLTQFLFPLCNPSYFNTSSNSLIPKLFINPTGNFNVVTGTECFQRVVDAIGCEQEGSPVAVCVTAVQKKPLKKTDSRSFAIESLQHFLHVTN